MLKYWRRWSRAQKTRFADQNFHVLIQPFPDFPGVTGDMSECYTTRIPFPGEMQIQIHDK